ncbi:MAG: hypothetical protein ACOYOF_01595 [Verrucomicrobiaceae bacterium]|jgi:DNA-binding response OmpR family regulator
MSEIPRVLLAVESLPYRRLIREALTAFRHCEVDDTPSGEYAFEIGLQRRHALYLFALTLPDMRGELLDRLLSKAGPLVHEGLHAAPPVIYLLNPEEATQWQDLARHARVRGHLFLPPRLDQLLQAIASLLPEAK